MKCSDRPMLASIGTEQDLYDPNYIYEPKLDGFRALCCIANGKTTLLSRNQLDITQKYPELLSLSEAIAAKKCVLDGEIVAFNKKGMPQFQALLQRDQNGVATQNRQSQVHIKYVVFDILRYGQESCLHMPLLQRKELLHTLVIPHGIVQLVPYTTDGPTLWNLIKKYDFEGMMAKRKAGLYYPGKRTREWLKIKLHKDIDCLIVGYTMQKRAVSSLLLAVYTAVGTLHYLGKVGTGFSQKEMGLLCEKLRALEITDPPLEIERQFARRVIWVKPTLVCQVSYKRITQDIRLRIASFVRLRTDKKPRECTLETQIKSTS